ncbi:hypothetical protein VPH35_137419 [Triticum aestivum]
MAPPCRSPTPAALPIGCSPSLPLGRLALPQRPSPPRDDHRPDSSVAAFCTRVPVCNRFSLACVRSCSHAGVFLSCFCFRVRGCCYLYTGCCMLACVDAVLSLLMLGATACCYALRAA